MFAPFEIQNSRTVHMFVDEDLDKHDAKVRADAIDEYKKKIEFEYKWLLDCKVFEPNVGIAFNTLISYAEQLKEQNNDNNGIDCLSDAYELGRVDVIEELMVFVKEKQDFCNERICESERKADIESENYFSGALWYLQVVVEQLEQLKEQK